MNTYYSNLIEGHDTRPRDIERALVVPQLMGHANVDTTLNVYTQVLDGWLRVAVDKVGGELFTIVH